MNTLTSGPPPEGGDPVAAVARMAAALELVTRGGLDWRAVAAPGAVTLTHGWDDGSVDTVVVGSPRAVFAYRENPGGREVWRVEGGAEHVADALRDLPAPTEPGAPDGTEHTPGRDGNWAS